MRIGGRDVQLLAVNNFASVQDQNIFDMTQCAVHSAISTTLVNGHNAHHKNAGLLRHPASHE